MARYKFDESSSIPETIKSLTQFFFPFKSDDKKDEKEVHDFDHNELNNFYANAPSVAFIYNHKSTTYDYFSPNIKKVMGYENSDFQNGGLKFSMSLVHPDHVKVYNRHVLPLMFKYYSIYAFKGKVKDLVFSYTFRIKRNDGEYIWALHYMNSIRVNKWGLPVLTLVNITDITALKKDQGIDFSVSVKEEDSITKTILSRVFPTKNNTLHFSEREIEILSLMSEGKRSKEIADELCISKHTVSTHRKNMMDKANVKNSYELIHLARTKGIITETKMI
ncbi:MAG: hypothetical protein JWO58_1494 [Chitinophagaceae bacterium]|nr:hypothetical protein [Chitinophagaceae bacterium]